MMGQNSGYNYMNQLPPLNPQRTSHILPTIDTLNNNPYL